MTRPRLDYGLLAALVLPLVAIAPLFQQAGIPNSADGVIHLLRQVDFDRAVRAGALVPRWGADLYLGFGYPLYNFAPPLLAYAVEALGVLGVPLDLALKCAIAATFELASAGMYLFMRDKAGMPGALAAAALSVYAPFRLREALVTGGNYPQFLAMALFPLVLWAYDELLAAPTRGRFAVAALSIAALPLSHLFHAAVFVPVAALYVLMRLITLRAGRGAWLASLGAGGLGLALASFFWLPALLEAGLTSAGAEHFAGASDFHQRFLTWQRLLAPPRPLDLAEANADVPLALGWAQLVAGALGTVALLRGRADRIAPAFLLGAFALFTFLQMPASEFVWNAVPGLGLAEYPWRFMGVSLFALAVIGGYAVPRATDARTIALALVIAGTAAATAFPYTIAPRGFLPATTPTVEDVARYELATGARGLTTLDEYLPKTVQELPAERSAPLGGPKHDAPRTSVVSSQWSPRGEVLLLDLPQATRIRFRTFYFPGWSARLDGVPAPLDVARDGTFSLMVPAGRHGIETHFGDTPVRTAAGLASLGALGALGIAAWRMRAHAPPRSGEPVGARVLVAVAALAVVLAGARWVLEASGALTASRFEQLGGRVVFGEQLALLGGEVDDPVAGRGAELRARLFWQAERPLDTDYKVIVQLIAPDGRAVAGSDKQHPGDPVTQGEMPTSRLPPGKYLRDEHTLRVPADAAPGRYEVRAGAYDPQSGRRLRLANGETLFSIGTVEVR